MRLPKEADGKRPRKRLYATSKAEAHRLRRTLIAERHSGTLIVGVAPTLGEFAEFWLTHEVASQVRATTAHDYGFRLHRYVLPTLGDRKLDAITPKEVVELLGSLQKRGLSTSTVRGARTVLHVLFEAAIRLERVRNNPVTRTRPPKSVSGERTQVQPPLSTEEAQAYLSASADTPLEAFVFLCLYLGLRRGEALGLKWEDVDLDAGTLKVRRTLKEGTRFLPDGSGLTRPVCDEPKTKSSRREIPLPQPCVLALHRQRNRLKALRLAAGSAWQDSGFVFTNPLGGAVYASSVYQMFVRFTRSCGLRYVRIHDLRHTTAVLMLENEVPLEAVGQVLGHSSYNVTKDIYAPLVPKLTSRATATLAAALGNRLDQAPLRAAGVSRSGRLPGRRAGSDPRWVGE